MIISFLLKLKIDNTLVISDLKNYIKIVSVPNNFCAIRCKISILNFFSLNTKIEIYRGPPWKDHFGPPMRLRKCFF